ncbi:MAG: hypothetical protein P1U86_02515 [Verrucomicrobiales bacterium]|nr:hypothetical protein [Verrucomicrobiales bacterium]
MAAHSLRIDRTQDTAWNKGDFKETFHRKKKPESGDEALTKLSLFNEHLTALELVEHCASLLSSPDHRMYLGTIRRYHKDAIRILGRELQTVAMQRTNGPFLHLLESESHSLTEDCEHSLFLLKKAERKLRDSHLKLFKDVRAPVSLQNHFGMEVFQDVNGFIDGIDRIARSLP